MTREVVIKYTNEHGGFDEIRIEPRKIEFAFTPWHPDRQWILTAYDYRKCSLRAFAMSRIKNWEPIA